MQINRDLIIPSLRKIDVQFLSHMASIQRFSFHSWGGLSISIASMPASGDFHVFIYLFYASRISYQVRTDSVHMHEYQSVCTPV